MGRFCPLLKGRICEDSVSAIAKCSQLTSQELQGQHPVCVFEVVYVAQLNLRLPLQHLGTDPQPCVCCSLAQCLTEGTDCFQDKLHCSSK